MNYITPGAQPKSCIGEPCPHCSERMYPDEQGRLSCENCVEEQRINMLEGLADKRILLETVIANSGRNSRHAYMKEDIQDIK